MNKHVFRPILACILISIVLMTACSPLGLSTAQTDNQANSYYNDPASKENSYQADSIAPDMYSSNGLSPEASPYDNAGVANGTGTGTLAGELTDGRKLIRTVSLDLETRDMPTLVTSVSDKVAALGGYIEESTIDSGSTYNPVYYGNYYPQNKSAYILARVPSDKLDEFINQVSDSGNVTSKNENTSDVSLQYTDIESHKKTLEIEQDRMWALLEKAEDVDSIIALESRLSEIRYELESYESQLRLYDNQVDYSTVTINITEVAEFTPVEEESILTRMSNGFKTTLVNMKTAGIDFLVGFVSALPALVIIAIIFLIIFIIIRKHNKKHKA